MNTALLATLKQTFGYDSFRPLQEEIIADALAGRDVFALLPTGGGKSLCFQLPALLRDGLTLVVSPLIALMKDQVDALTAAGIPATFLNSTLGEKASKERLSGLYNGQYRLLYVAPERLMAPGFLERLREWKVVQLAIDEAHCISEWGHDFRPEYRQIAALRDRLPGVPFMALTATATDRVRGDIVAQLHLQDARCYVASFNRPNLAYRVVPKADGYGQTRRFIRERAGECGIVYCFSRSSAESLAGKLAADGIAARPYHAGLSDTVRAENQELFLRDEVRVICATIAFGMGINKPNVRFVLHYELPKNIEGYYQETGRAGRDGLPGECLLLFNPGDAMKQARFIDEKTDPGERRNARAQLQQMVQYAECNTCRRGELLAYFGERYPEPNCAACDNCLTPRETFDGTIAAQKFLSCVWRARDASRSRSATFGINHHADILSGAGTERIRKWEHTQLSTYGVGKEHARGDWQHIGRELVRLGLLRLAAGEFPTVELTEAGVQFLKTRTPLALTRPPAKPRRPRQGEPATEARPRTRRAGDIPCDEALFEVLRSLRRKFADERDVPSYVIFTDVSLRLMAQKYPTSEAEFSQITGDGAQKLQDFAAAFTAEVAAHLADHPRQRFD